MMPKRWRTYHGLPVTLMSERPSVFHDMEQDASRGDYDIGRFGLRVKVVDSDPYYAGLIYQDGVPVAKVGCLAGKDNLADALKEESPETLAQVFGIRVDGPL